MDENKFKRLRLRGSKIRDEGKTRGEYKLSGARTPLDLGLIWTKNNLIRVR